MPHFGEIHLSEKGEETVIRDRRVLNKRIQKGYIRMIEYHHTESVSGHFLYTLYRQSDCGEGVWN